ncbi:MAG: hypothetical protein U0R49_07290 [Fimbriimonadales bacterium]
MQNKLYSQQLDIILAGIEKDSNRPFSPENLFEAATRRGRTHRFARKFFDRPSDPVRYLRIRQLEHAIERSRLSPTQLQVFLARLQGHTFVAIAARHGRTPQASFQTYQVAAAKVRRAWVASPMLDLPLVYYAEMNRARPLRIETE